MNINKYEKSSIEEATVLHKKNEKNEDIFFLKNDSWSYHHNNQEANIRMEFDRWADVHVNDLKSFGFTPMKPLPPPAPIEFFDIVRPYKVREVENHGMTYDITSSFCVELPPYLLFSEGDRVKITIQRAE